MTNTPRQELSAGIRIASMVIDHFVMTFVTMLFMVIAFIIFVPEFFEVTHHQQSFPERFGLSIFIYLIGMSMYICKDCIQGRSVAKRLLKHQIIDYSSGQVASPLKCMVRNIFIILWPVEVIVTLFSPDRRLGDLVAGTKVVELQPEHRTEQINFPQTGLSFILSYALMVLVVMLPFQYFLSGFTHQQVPYVEHSLNEQAALDTEQLFEDYMGEILTADVLIYDQIKSHQDLKYISMIVRLNENFLNSNTNFEAIRTSVESVLFTEFPEGTFVGQVIYVYTEPGSQQSRTVRLDWREEQ